LDATLEAAMTQCATVTALPTGRATPKQRINQLYLDVADNGHCADGADDEKYFPNRTITAEEAEQACEGCPVIRECLEMALLLRTSHGIYGGTTPEQRAEILGLEAAVA
jgi:hypothetical protein